MYVNQGLKLGLSYISVLLAAIPFCWGAEKAQLTSQSTQTVIPLTVGYHDDDDLVLTFQGYRGRAAALFVDQGVLFCVLDQDVILDTDKNTAAITRPLKDKSFFVRTMTQIPTTKGNGAVLALSLTGRVGGRLVQKQGGLSLHLVGDDVSAAKGAALPSAAHSSDFKLHMPNVQSIVEWESPHTGHAYGAVLMAGTGILNPIYQGDFTLLKTVQGVVIKKYRDDLTLIREGEWVRVLGAEPLPPAPPSNGRSVPHVPWLTLPSTKNPPALFLDEWQNYEQSIKNLKPHDRLNKRLESAQFLLKHRLAVEASAALSDAIHENPRAFLDPRVRALKAVSLALSDRPFMANRVLSYFRDKDDPDLRIWQGYSDLKRGYLAAGIETLTAQGGVLKSYPPPLKTPILLALAAAARDVGRSGMGFLDDLSLGALSPFETAQYHLLRAHFLADQKKNQAAQHHLKIALTHPDTTIMADGLVVQNVLTGDGDKTPKTSKMRQKRIEFLENMRFYRRHDHFEKKVLSELVHLYHAEGRLDEALFLLRQLLDYFPGTPEKQEARLLGEHILCQLIHKMTDAPALKVLGIYAKYQDLAPKDHRKWDLNLIRADQYIDLDLLDEARQVLMDNQNSPNLPPQIGAKGALRLAFMDYRMGRFQGGLDHLTLFDEKKDGIPSHLSRQALFLKARLFIALNRPWAALSLLRGDRGDDSLYFQVQILRFLKQWPAARDLLQSMVNDAVQTQKPADVLIVQLASLLSQLGDNDGKKRLKIRYGALMAKSPHGDLFDLLTQTTGQVPTDHETLLRQLDEGENLDKLLNRIRG